MLVLETDRLLVHPISNEHADFMVQLLNDPDFKRFIGDRNVSTSAQACTYISEPIKSFHESGIGLFVVQLKSSLQSIGICSLLLRDHLPDHDIGFAFLPEFCGKGYALEATQATLDYAVEQLGHRRILAVTNVDNVRSITLLEKLGMQFDSRIQFSPDGPESNLFVIDFDSN